MDTRNAMGDEELVLNDGDNALNLDKKVLAAGLALVAVGLIMARSSRCNRFCKYIGKRMAFTGSSQFVKAFLA